MKEQYIVKFTVKYLRFLAIVQLIGLNLAGFFWFGWAYDIERGDTNGIKWINIWNSLYVLVGIYMLIHIHFISPEEKMPLKFFGAVISTSPIILSIFLVCVLIIYGIPLWLVNSEKMSLHFKVSDDKR